MSGPGLARARWLARASLVGGASFLAVHLAWVATFLAYTALRTGGRYLGTSIDRVPNLVTVLLGHFAYRAMVPALGVAMLVAVPIALVARLRSPAPTVRAAARIGALSYAAITAVLLLSAPAAFVRLPLLSRLPIGADLALAAIALAVMVGVMWRHSSRATLLWLATMSVPAWLPHDAVRVVRALALPARPASAPRTLLFVIDALRLDSFCELAPAPWRTQAHRGVSHFGSTRKQYRLLFTGDAPAVAGAFFIPSRADMIGDQSDDGRSDFGTR